MNTKYILPKHLKNANGEIRKAGFEIEFSDVGLIGSADVVKELFGGTVNKVSNFKYEITNTRYGDFSVEIDTSILVEKKYEQALKDVGIIIENIDFKNKLEDFLSDVATIFIPFEIVTPPIPFDEFGAIEKLKTALRKKGAKGSGASIINAFGLHINIETPSDDPAILLNYLRAFLLLQDWIIKISHIDFTRKLTPFIDDFPEAYIALVINDAYNPDIDTFINDYLRFNPTRNRSLDMIPLFSFLKKGIIFKEVKEQGLIKPRPAFHYRLPNCLINEPEWSPADEWNLWYEVEKLADDQSKLIQTMNKFNKIYFSFNGKSNWVKEVEILIADQEK